MNSTKKRVNANEVYTEQDFKRDNLWLKLCFFIVVLGSLVSLYFTCKNLTNAAVDIAGLIACITLGFVCQVGSVTCAKMSFTERRYLIPAIALLGLAITLSIFCTFAFRKSLEYFHIDKARTDDPVLSSLLSEMETNASAMKSESKIMKKYENSKYHKLKYLPAKENHARLSARQIEITKEIENLRTTDKVTMATAGYHGISVLLGINPNSIGSLIGLFYAILLEFVTFMAAIFMGHFSEKTKQALLDLQTGHNRYWYLSTPKTKTPDVHQSIESLDPPIDDDVQKENNNPVEPKKKLSKPNKNIGSFIDKTTDGIAKAMGLKKTESDPNSAKAQVGFLSPTPNKSNVIKLSGAGLKKNNALHSNIGSPSLARVSKDQQFNFESDSSKKKAENNAIKKSKKPDNVNIDSSVNETEIGSEKVLTKKKFIDYIKLRFPLKKNGYMKAQKVAGDKMNLNKEELYWCQKKLKELGCVEIIGNNTNPLKTMDEMIEIVSHSSI